MAELSEFQIEKLREDTKPLTDFNQYEMLFCTTTGFSHHSLRFKGKKLFTLNVNSPFFMKKGCDYNVQLVGLGISLTCTDYDPQDTLGIPSRRCNLTDENERVRAFYECVNLGVMRICANHSSLIVRIGVDGWTFLNESLDEEVARIRIIPEEQRPPMWEEDGYEVQLCNLIDISKNLPSWWLPFIFGTPTFKLA